uniref:Secreted phosphoprotein 1 n=1 Tax=Myripristis murdjan TaxID=586833 RepID=A0A667XDN9_9TELE
MKVAVVFVLLFATVLCRPVSFLKCEMNTRVKQIQVLVLFPPVESVYFAGCVSLQQAVAGTPSEVTAAGSDTTSTSDSASVNSQDSEDSDDSDDKDDDETEESETEEDESSDSSESGESSTPSPATLAPVVVTDEPVLETTVEPITPTIVTDPARGDSMGSYPGEYKSIIYVEDKSYQKMPSPYKSYEFVGAGKKMAYDMTDGNEVEKTLTVYKALQVHNDLLEEDTSTPEVESQGLDASSGTSQDQEVDPRQAALPQEEESASASDATTSEGESSSATQEEEDDESTSTASDSDSASASEESEDEDSQSSEEAGATATPGTSDSDSDETDSSESDSDEDAAATDATTDAPVVITAK